MVKWLQGKKTYIGAGLLAAAAVAGFFLGKIDATALTMVLGGAMAMAGLSAKLNRYLPDAVQALEEIKAKDFGKLIITGGKVALETAAVPTIQAAPFEDGHVAGDPPSASGQK